MPRAIVHEDGLFFEWSTIVDAPVSMAMPRDEMRAYLVGRCGDQMSERDIDARLDRAVANGTSAIRNAAGVTWLTREDIAEFNRAGPNESHLPWPELMARLTKPPLMPDDQP